MAFNKETIENVKFDLQRKGYHMDQVNEFLDLTASMFEKLEEENAKLKQEIEEYEKTRASLSEALIVAQNMSRTLVDNAKNEADALIGNAKNQADLLLGNTKIETEKMRQEVVNLENTIRKKTEEEQKGLLQEIEKLKRFTESYKAQIAAELEHCAKTFREAFVSDQIYEKSEAAKEIDSVSETKQEFTFAPAEEEGEDTTPIEEALEKEITPDAEALPDIPKEEVQEETDGQEMKQPVQDLKEEKQSIDPTLFKDDVKREDELKKTAEFDLNAILENLPEDDAELKKMIDELI